MSSRRKRSNKDASSKHTIFKLGRIIQIIAARSIRADIASQDRLTAEDDSRLNIAQNHIEELSCVKVVGRPVRLNVGFGFKGEIPAEGQVVAVW